MPHKQSHKNRTLWLIGTLHAFTHLYQVALLPLYLRIQQDLRLSSVEQATLLVTVLGLAYFVPSYPLGALADRLSRKKLLTLGLAINGLGFVGLSFAPNYAWALVSVAVAGFGGSFYHPSATALIARLFPEARGRALGLVGIGASVGFFVGPMYAGWRAVTSGSWRVPVCELGVFGIFAAGLFAWLANEERRAPALRVDRFRFAQSWSSALRLFPSQALWLFFLGASFALSLRDFAGSAMSTSASLFLQNAHGFSPKLTGLALSGIFLASVVSNPLFGSLSDRGRMRWVALVLLLAAALISAFPRVPVAWMPPVLLAYGFFFMASYPITEAALMESVPDAVRGRIFGLFITVGGLVGNLSHWLVGGWIHRLGAQAFSAGSYLPLYAVLSLMVVFSLTGLPLLHAIRKREHLPTAQPGVVPLSALHTTDPP